MEKSILIDGKNVRFKATGGLGYRYKSQFGREYLSDIMELEKFSKSGDKADYDYTKLNLDVLYNLLWTMAKTADDTIPPPVDWLDSFDTFPVFEIYNQLQDILLANMKTDSKNA